MRTKSTTLTVVLENIVCVAAHNVVQNEKEIPKFEIELILSHAKYMSTRVEHNQQTIPFTIFFIFACMIIHLLPQIWIMRINV